MFSGGERTVFRRVILLWERAEVSPLPSPPPITGKGAMFRALFWFGDAELWLAVFGLDCFG